GAPARRALHPAALPHRRAGPLAARVALPGARSRRDRAEPEHPARRAPDPPVARAPRSLDLLGAADRPEVVGQAPVLEVGVGHGEVALHPPGGSPEVADDERLLGIVVADSEHRVAPDGPLGALRHGDDAGLRHPLRFEALVHREAEHEGESPGEAGPHLVTRLEPRIGRDLMRERFPVAGGGRLQRELRDGVRPRLLRARALLRQRLDAVAQHGPCVLLDGVLHHPLVVVDEQPAQVGERDAVLAFQELERADERVARAAAQATLILDRRAGPSEIDRRGLLRGDGTYHPVADVPMIRQVGYPPEAAGTRRTRLPGGLLPGGHGETRRSDSTERASRRAAAVCRRAAGRSHLTLMRSRLGSESPPRPSLTWRVTVKSPTDV